MKQNCIPANCFTGVTYLLVLLWKDHQTLRCLNQAHLWQSTFSFEICLTKSISPVLAPRSHQYWHLDPKFPSCAIRTTAWSHFKVTCCHERAHCLFIHAFGHGQYLLLTLSSQDCGIALLNINEIPKTIKYFYWSPQLLSETEMHIGGWRWGQEQSSQFMLSIQQDETHQCWLASSG